MPVAQKACHGTGDERGETGQEMEFDTRRISVIFVFKVIGEF